MHVHRWSVTGVTRTLADDFTFMCLDMAWGPLLAFVSSVYIGVGAAFALLFWALIVRLSRQRSWCSTDMLAAGAAFLCGVQS